MINKLIGWVGGSLGGILGVLQAVVKFAKEVLTLVVDLLFPIIPSKHFKSIVNAIRNIVNKLDSALERIKSFFLQKTPN